MFDYNSPGGLIGGPAGQDPELMINYNPQGPEVSGVRAP